MGFKETILEGSIYIGYWALAYFILSPIILAVSPEIDSLYIGIFAMLFSVVMVRLFKRHNRKLGRMSTQ